MGGGGLGSILGLLLQFGGRRFGIGGIIAIIAVIALLKFGGGDALGCGGGGSNYQAAPSGQTTGQGIDPAKDPDAEQVAFIKAVMDDIQDTFTDIHPRYQRAKLVIFTSAVDTACGQASSDVGPFYCPPDRQAYIDLSFFRDLRAKFGAPGDFAQAYVLAHEIGHHMQNLDGAEAGQRSNAHSVKQELQADCYAGVWAHSAEKRGALEAGDVEEALAAATAIGDDRLQKQAGRRVNPETWTHGSSEQRMRWFQIGMRSGKLASCDTFNAAQL